MSRLVCGALILFSILVSNLALAATKPVAVDANSIEELYASNAGLRFTSPTTNWSSWSQREFRRVFYEMLSTLDVKGVALDPWFRPDHFVYFSDFFDDDEKRELRDVFTTVSRKVKAGEKDIRLAVRGAGPAELIAKLRTVDGLIAQLKAVHKGAIDFAITKHEVERQQKYGDHDYSYHLRKVREVLKRFGYGPKDSFLGLLLGTAAWLHDSLEDTDATFRQLEELFGREIAEIVLGVTKVAKQPGMTSEVRLRLTYERTRLMKGARILKLADRIANVEEGLSDLFAGRPTKVHKYFSEWPTFQKMLYVPGDADAMWAHLEMLLTDSRRARAYIESKIRIENERAAKGLLCESLFIAF